ncbi:MAG TPA: cytochrome c4, partial [Burkholderiales bacterium]
MHVSYLIPVFAALLASLASAATPPSDTVAERVKPCLACHALEGKAGRDAYYPRIAGKPQGYLYQQLLNFRDGRRNYAPMTLLLENLSDRYLAEMATHFAGLRAPYPPPRAEGTPAERARGAALVRHGDPSRNIPACVACHGQNLMGATPSIPGLLNLPRDYINAQFGAWRTGLRHARAPDCMAQIAQRL